MRRLACGVLAACIATAAPAIADDAVEPVRIEVDANVECSNDHLFFDEVRARTARVRWADPDETARTFRIRIRGEGSDHVGTLTIVDEAKASAPRLFKADSCKSVIDALAFVAAVSIDPAAYREAVLVLPPALASPPPPPPAPPEWPSEIPLEARVAPSPRPTESPSVPEPPRPVREGWVFAVGLGAVVEGPDALANDGLGARVFAELGRAIGTGKVALAPTVRLSFDLPSSWSTQLEPTSFGQASFTWTRGSADVCPLRVRLAASLFAAPCGGVEAGVIEASAPKAPGSLSPTNPWVALTVSGRLRFAFLRVLFAEAEPFVSLPFVRQQFRLVGATNDVYQAPPLYVGGVLALGIHFP